MVQIVQQVLSEDSDTLKRTLKNLGIHLKPAVFKLDVRPLLKLVLSQFFGPSTGLIDMLAEHVPNPRDAAQHKVMSTYTGPMTSTLAQAMMECDSEGPVMVQITKLYPSEDAQDFHAFGRVLSGTVRKGMQVKVLGEGYSAEDEEDMAVQVVENVWVNESR